MSPTVLPGGVELIFEEDRPVATVRLARPEVRNAQTMATWSSLARAAEIIAECSDIACVVLRGAGSEFSAGLDLRMLRGSAPPGEGDLRELLTHDDAAVQQAIAGFQQGFTCWRELPVVVVAAVTGRAIGAGFQLALAADLRIFAQNASVRMAEAALGLVPDLGGTGRLIELVGYARALEICATAEPVDATRAERIGLANAVVPEEDFEAGLLIYLHALLEVDTVVTRSIKPLLAHGVGATAADQLAAERAAQVQLLRRLSSAIR